MKHPLKKFPANPKKFENMILYFAKASQGDPLFGATKLNKQLFYADYFAYAKLGTPISAMNYFHIERGPAPRAMLPTRTRMIADGACTIQKVSMGASRRPQDRVVALRDPDLSDFSADELSVMEEVVAELRCDDGTDVTNKTHDLIAWKAAADRENIPWESIFVASRKPTRREIEFAKKLTG